MSSAVKDSLKGSIYAYLVSLSMITRIKSYSSLVIGSLESSSLTTKSYAIDFYSLEEVLSNFINPSTTISKIGKY